MHLRYDLHYMRYICNSLSSSTKSVDFADEIETMSYIDNNKIVVYVIDSLELEYYSSLHRFKI